LKQLLLDIQPPSAPTLENFICGQNTEALHSLRMALAGDQGARFIYGALPAVAKAICYRYANS